MTHRVAMLRGDLPVLVLATFLAALFVPLSAFGHERSVSYSTWSMTGTRARVVVRMSELELTRLGERSRFAEQYIVEHLQLSSEGEPCVERDAPHRLNAPRGRVAFEWEVDCPRAHPLRIHSELFADVAPSHMHFVRVTGRAGGGREVVLTDTSRGWDVPNAAGASNDDGLGLTGSVKLGIGHILSGYDHLAFLLVLILASVGWRDVVKVVTGFTVGHSVTLALAATGRVNPEAGAIEALIGLSIAVVAVENLWQGSGWIRAVPALCVAAVAFAACAGLVGRTEIPALTLFGVAFSTACYFAWIRVSQTEERQFVPVQARWVIALLFGMVHGFGFAAVLTEARLPPDALLAVLFGFNLGVEVGQIACVAAVWPLLRWASNRPRLGESVHDAGSGAVLALGVFWFVTRTFG